MLSLNQIYVSQFLGVFEVVQLPHVFDPSTVAPSTGESGQLPVSDAKGHLVIIHDSSIEQVQGKQGAWYLRLLLKVVEGPHTDAEGRMQLNLGSDSADAVRIADSQLSAICHVVNYLQPLQNIDVLYNRPFRVIVALQKDKEAAEKGYTEVKKVLDAHGNKPGQPGPRPAPAPAPSGFPASQPQQPQPTFAPPAQQPQPTQVPNPSAAPWAQQR